jgi:hypothetical protein
MKKARHSETDSVWGRNSRALAGDYANLGLLRIAALHLHPYQTKSTKQTNYRTETNQKNTSGLKFVWFSEAHIKVNIPENIYVLFACLFV